MSPRPRRTRPTHREPPVTLKCASCGKVTGARHAAILQGWYSGQGGAMYCSSDCTSRAPKPKGRERALFLRTNLPGATKAEDVDRWMETVLAPALAKFMVDVQRDKREGWRGQVTGAAGHGVLREFIINDYEHVLKLWKSTEGIVLREVDERPAIKHYLSRNRGMSFVHEVGQEVVGVVLCGSDGRRGFLHHLAVAPEHRRHGLGRALVTAALQALAKAGIDKCHLMVLPSNAGAREFWKRLGWVERTDVLLMSHTLSSKPEA